MKSFLSKLTAMSMVATTATTDALQWPSLLRGSDAQVDTSIQSSDCEDGYNDGVEDVENMWEKKPFYGDCDNAWGLSDAAEDLKEDKYPEDDSNWRMDTYYKCGRNGVDDEVATIEKECFYDSSSQCTDLGNAAAEIVVMDNWCTPSGAYGAAHKDPNYKKECKEAAVTICEGNISNVANRWCPDKNLSTGKLKQLQDECEDQVNDMVGTDDDDDDDTDRDLDDCGRDGSCGSCKKAYCPDVTERQECKERQCSMEDLLVFFPEDVEAHAIN